MILFLKLCCEKMDFFLLKFYHFHLRKTAKLDFFAKNFFCPQTKGGGKSEAVPAASETSTTSLAAREL